MQSDSLQAESASLNRDRGGQQNLRLRSGAPPGDFPEWFYRDGPER